MKGLVLCVLLSLSLSVQITDTKLKTTSIGRAVLAMVELGSPSFNPLFDALEAWASVIEVINSFMKAKYS
jgi:hypothetical protein